MNKICTSLEQSNKLIELGIDVSTADMYWWYSGRRYYVESMDDDDFNKESDIPAWSLSALLDILAKETHNIDEDGYVVLSSYKGNWWNISPINCISEEINESNNPIDAAFEMICWLLENGKI